MTVRGTPALKDDAWVIAGVEWIPPAVPYRDQEGSWTVEADTYVQVGDTPKDLYESTS